MVLNDLETISAESINLDKISVEILEIFKPLLVEMENFNENLDKEEFILSGMSLVEKLDINKRNIVLNYGKVSKSCQPIENSFAPKITKKSIQIVKQMLGG